MTESRYVVLVVAVTVMLVSEVLVGTAVSAVAQILPIILVAVGLGAALFVGCATVPAGSKLRGWAMVLCVLHVAVNLVLTLLFVCKPDLSLAIMPAVQVCAGVIATVVLSS